MGDLVLALNGISLDGMSVDQARQIMNSSSKTIQLEIKHPTPQLRQHADTFTHGGTKVRYDQTFLVFIFITQLGYSFSTRKDIHKSLP